MNDQHTPSTTPYWLRILRSGKVLTQQHHSQIMLLYFVIYGLKLEGSLHLLTEAQKQQICIYVASLQSKNNGGFAACQLYSQYCSTESHIVFAYSALNILKILGKLELINASLCIQSIAKAQQTNGGFTMFHSRDDVDLRAVYAAIACCRILSGFHCIDVDSCVAYIYSCRNPDGGYGLEPNRESHAGATFCAVASLCLLDRPIPFSYRTNHFLAMRVVPCQEEKVYGVQGRLGKKPDSCYTFWVGAALSLLMKNSLCEEIKQYLICCFNGQLMGYGKYPRSQPDPTHTLHAILGLKIMEGGIQSISLCQGNLC